MDKATLDELFNKMDLVKTLISEVKEVMVNLDDLETLIHIDDSNVAIHRVRSDLSKYISKVDSKPQTVTKAKRPLPPM